MQSKLRSVEKKYNKKKKQKAISWVIKTQKE